PDTGLAGQDDDLFARARARGETFEEHLALVFVRADGEVAHNNTQHAKVGRLLGGITAKNNVFTKRADIQLLAVLGALAHGDAHTKTRQHAGLLSLGQPGTLSSRQGDPITREAGIGRRRPNAQGETRACWGPADKLRGLYFPGPKLIHNGARRGNTQRRSEE